MKRKPFYVVTTILLALSFILGGCSATTGTSKFYVLNPLSNSGPVMELGKDLSIGVGPIKFPGYLTQPQIVTRVSANEIKISEFKRWAVYLPDHFSQILADNLSTLLSTERIYVFPWKKSTPIQYQVLIDISHFEAGVDGEVQLTAKWEIMGENDKDDTLIKKSNYNHGKLLLSAISKG